MESGSNGVPVSDGVGVGVGVGVSLVTATLSPCAADWEAWRGSFGLAGAIPAPTTMRTSAPASTTAPALRPPRSIAQDRRPVTTMYRPVSSAKSASMIKAPAKPDEATAMPTKTSARIATMIVDLASRNDPVPGGVWFDKEGPPFRDRAAVSLPVPGATTAPTGNPSI